MKLGISDYYYDTDWELAPVQRWRIYRQAGFSCIDFSTAKTTDAYYTESASVVEKLMAEIRNQLDGEGMTVYQVHGPWCWPPIKDETAEGRVLRLAEMKHSMDLAKMLGAKCWVVHPIMPHRVRDIPEGNAESTWALNLEFMSALAAYAEQIHLTVCLENMPHRNFSMAKPEKVLEMVEQIGSPYFQICLDTGHVATQEGMDIAEQVRLLGSHIRALHIHDNSGEKDQHLYPGRGVIPWKDFAQALKDVGFSGVFSLETNPAGGLAEPEFIRQAQELAHIAQSISAQL